jgi:dimethylargininase
LIAEGGKVFRSAIVRPPAANFADGLTTAELGEPIFDLALEQHQAYCRALESCRLSLIQLPPDPQHPDSTFVEDTAILAGTIAILCRPGAPSRLGEVEGVRDSIRGIYSTVHEITPPGTVDGGDVCEAGSHFFLGISHRTNEEGVRQLASILSAAGYSSSTVDIRSMRSILHLKSGIAYLDRMNLVVMEELAHREEFAGYNLIRVDAEESYACNCVLVNERLLTPAGFPLVSAELELNGYSVLPLEMSEFRKMDGGLSCLSLRF